MGRLSPPGRLSPWLRRIPLAGAIALTLGWLPYQLYGRSGLARLLKLRAEVATLREGNLALKAKNRELRAELGLYDDDDRGVVERIARDDLGLVKRGEVVFKVEGAP